MNERPWLASYRRFGLPTEIEAPDCASVTELMERAMRRFADRPAFRSFGQTLTYGELDRLSRDFAAWLQAQGIHRGDRVAVMTPNLLAFPVAMLGIIRAGAIQVNVNPLYTAPELEHQLNDADCDTIVIFNGSTPALAEIVGNTAIRRIVTTGPSIDAGKALPGPDVDPRLTNTVRLTDALVQGAALTFTPVELGPDDLLFLQYTGGTTGLSKGAELSHGNLLANVAQFSAFMPEALRPGEEVIVTAIPLYHIFALMVNFISYFHVGAENWLVANPRDMDGFVETLRAARPTVFTAVGGGAAIIPTVSARWQAITGQFIREGYGLSETSPVVTFNPSAVTEFSGTTGLPVPSTDVRLQDDSGLDVAPGQPGEVCVRGPQVTRGYWRQPEANAAAFTADGYFRTGDIGVFDEGGFLKIVDRKKDMILVSGFNVYPNDVEAVASACPGVAECACVGAPDDKTGEAVTLFVVKAPGAQLDEAGLIAHCRQSLTAYKVPRVVKFVDALPKTAVGKILRRHLRNT